MNDRDLGSENPIIDLVSSSVIVGTVPATNSSVIEDCNTRAKNGSASRGDEELRRPKCIKHKTYLKCCMLISGKTEERLYIDYFWNHFLTRSNFKAILRILFL